MRFRKLQEAIWQTIINEIFQLLPHFDPFCYENYLDELSLGYPNYPTQKWNIWASFKASRKRFCKLQEAMWPTVVNKIFKFPPHLDPCLYELSSDYLNYKIQKWYTWAGFQASRKRFRKLQEAIWLTVINEIFKFPPHFDPFGYVNYLYELSLGYPNYPTQKWYIWASFQTSRKRFCKLQEAIWLTVMN